MHLLRAGSVTKEVRDWVCHRRAVEERVDLLVVEGDHASYSGDPGGGEVIRPGEVVVDVSDGADRSMMGRSCLVRHEVRVPLETRLTNRTLVWSM